MSQYGYNLSQIMELPFACILPLAQLSVRVQNDNAINVIVEGRLASQDQKAFSSLIDRRGKIFRVQEEVSKAYLTPEAHMLSKELAQWVKSKGKEHIKGMK